MVVVVVVKVEGGGDGSSDSGADGRGVTVVVSSPLPPVPPLGTRSTWGSPVTTSKANKITSGPLSSRLPFRHGSHVSLLTRNSAGASPRTAKPQPDTHMGHVHTLLGVLVSLSTRRLRYI